jgi:hypothetical protein
MLYVCEMRVGVSIFATTSVKRTSYGHLITQPQLPFGQRRPWGRASGAREIWEMTGEFALPFASHLGAQAKRYSHNIAHS